MPPHRYRRGPWYRGGVPRSYVAPTVFTPIGCATSLVGVSVILIIGGGALLGISSFQRSNAGSSFSSDFFKKGPNIPDLLRTIGTVVLGIACTMFAIGIIMCIVAGCLARKQERKRHAEQRNPLTAGFAQRPPPPSAYPHQPPPQNVYPLASTYPSQPVGSNIRTQTQYEYPTQPAGYPPPRSNAPPLTGDQYPTPSYCQSVVPRAPAQDAGNIEQQLLEQKT